jgi:hypothetical protein
MKTETNVLNKLIGVCGIAVSFFYMFLTCRRGEKLGDETFSGRTSPNLG